MSGVTYDGDGEVTITGQAIGGSSQALPAWATALRERALREAQSGTATVVDGIANMGSGTVNVRNSDVTTESGTVHVDNLTLGPGESFPKAEDEDEDE
jgi:hypothetical protein